MRHSHRHDPHSRVLQPIRFRDRSVLGDVRPAVGDQDDCVIGQISIAVTSREYVTGCERQSSLRVGLLRTSIAQVSDGLYRILFVFPAEKNRLETVVSFSND